MYTDHIEYTYGFDEIAHADLSIDAKKSGYTFYEKTGSRTENAEHSSFRAKVAAKLAERAFFTIRLGNVIDIDL
jgi:hypothetical protein